MKEVVKSSGNVMKEVGMKGYNSYDNVVVEVRMRGLRGREVCEVGEGIRCWGI